MGGIDERNSAGWKETLDPVIEKDRKSGNALSLARNSFRMFLLSGYCLCLWKTAWLQKPIGLLITLEWVGPAQRCIYEKEGEKRIGGWAASSVCFLFFCLFFLSLSFPLLYSHVVKSMTGLMLNTCVHLTFNVPSKLYLSSCVVVRVWLWTAPMPPRDTCFIIVQKIS